MSSKAEIHAVETLGWPFHGRPQHQAREGVGWGTTTELDPFPCYMHEYLPVSATLIKCEKAFHPRTPLYLYLSRFEDVSRTNGWATYRETYPYHEADHPFEVSIFFSGKRTPIHPAQSRYLTAHEYGHAVMYWFMHEMREENEDGGIEPMHEVEDRFMKEYCELRGIEFDDSYGGGHWHTNTKEIFANDWRTVLGVETEFWPHPVRKLRPKDAAWKWWEEDVLDA